MPEPDYAKIAYDAYVWHLDRVNAATMPLPPWDRVRQDIQDAWQAATHAASMALLEHDAALTGACHHCWHAPRDGQHGTGQVPAPRLCCWCGASMVRLCPRETGSRG